MAVGGRRGMLRGQLFQERNRFGQVLLGFTLAPLPRRRSPGLLRTPGPSALFVERRSALFFERRQEKRRLERQPGEMKIRARQLIADRLRRRLGERGAENLDRIQMVLLGLVRAVV